MLRFFEQSDTVDKLEHAFVLAQPLHRYMNACFQVETLTSKLHDALTVGNEAEQLQAREASFTARKKFVSGSRGMDVVNEFTSMLESYDDPLWTRMQMGESSKQLASLRMVVAMCEARRRLVWPFEALGKARQ